VTVLDRIGRKDYEISLKELSGHTRYREKPEKPKVVVLTLGIKSIHNMFCACEHVPSSKKKTDNVFSRNSGTHSCRCRGLK
jgi:hypothetical protein